MSWLAIIWSAVIGACLMQALMHLLVWNHDRRSWAHLCFVITVLSTAGLAIAELLTMHASSPEAFGRIIFWAHFIYGLGAFASLGFVHFFFGSGRNWLLAVAIGSRALAVVANVVTGVNLHIHAIHSLKQIPFLGSPVSVLGTWEPNPWVRLGQASALLQLLYILDDITADAKRAGSIIHGMRAMFRKTSPTEIESVDLNTAVHQVLHLINSEIIARHVSLDLQLAPDLPPAGASLVEIQQILMNLMVNSLDAVKTTNTPGLIKITSRIQDDQIVVSVHDNGPGLAPVQLENLFEPFATTKTNGLGLGLAISRRLTERFAGTLQGANHPEGGAIFHLTLPAKIDL